MSEIIEMTKRLLKEYFNEDRELTYIGDGEKDIFKSNDNEIVVFDFVMHDFDSKELAKYTVFAEDLFNKHESKIIINLMMHPFYKVTVEEFTIHSYADFSIRLAVPSELMCDSVLEIIKTKMKLGILLNETDINMLHIIPLFCSKDKRLYYREECFNILNKLGL